MLLSNNRDAILNIIKQIAGQSNILSIPRAFIDYMGDLDGGLFLSQLLYWSDRAGPKGYFYKSYLEWERETTLGEYEIRKAAKKLKSKGLLTTKVQKANGSPTLHYKLHNDRFSESFLEFLQKRTLRNYRNDPVESEGTIPEKVKEPLTETTTEIKTETTTKTHMSPSGDVAVIFDYWKSVHEHPRAQLDPKRKRAISDRLKAYSIEDLKKAIDGCKKSPHHQGKNDQGTIYDDIELICRDSKRVEQFIHYAENGSRDAYSEIQRLYESYGNPTAEDKPIH